MPWYFGNFQDSPNSYWNLMVVYFKYLRKNSKCLGIWKISKMPRFLRNSPNIQSIERFTKSLEHNTFKFL